MKDDDSSERGEDETILDDGGIDTDERAGRSQGIEPEAEPDEETQQEIEEERERRLDPENRPDGAEVDNTGRDFDTERGMFTDSDGYDEAEPEYEPLGADSSDDEDDESSDDGASEDE